MVDIDSATIAVDTSGVNKLETSIHTEVIQDAIKAMDDELEKLQAKIHEIWQGTSAETFIQNMNADEKKITHALEQAYKVLSEQIKNAEKATGEVDRTAVKARS